MAIHPAPGDSEDAHKLSFPAAHFAKIYPRDFLQAHLPSSRPSGRTPGTARRPTVHTGSLSHAQGSAVVRMGDTAAVCGVRAETLSAKDITPSPLTKVWLDRAATGNPSGDDAEALADLGLLVPNIELATGCNPQHLPGSPPSVLAQSLTQRLLTLLRITRLLSLDQLIIWAETPSNADGSDEDAMDVQAPPDGRPTRKPVAFWTLYIDVLLISLDGSAFSAAWSSVTSALTAISLPEARWDADRTCVLCNPDLGRARRLRVNGLPFALDFAIFVPSSTPGSEAQKLGPQALVDPDDFEESCCAEGATVVVDDAGEKIWRIEKNGGVALDRKMTKALIDHTGQAWTVWKKVLGDIDLL